MKIVFFGSDDFAAENLKRLLEENFFVVACVTQPDRPSGRGLKVIASPIKVISQEKKIPVLQPEDLKDTKFLTQLKNFQADLFSVIAYGKILPASVLKIPKLFCINVHGSLLPKYRGAAPINWAMINGEKETGFSIIKMNTKMDAGEIIAQEKMAISDEETSQTLRERMAKQSAECLCRTVKELEKGKFSLNSQDEKKVTFAPKLDKELGKIDWKKPAGEVHNLVRGLLPWPAAHAIYKGRVLKVLQTKVVPQTPPQPSGTILQINKEGIFVSTEKDTLLLQQVHPESGKPMSAYSFSVGHGVKVGSRFE